jgi:hypothetical protein
MQYRFKATGLIVLMLALVMPLIAWGQTETIDENLQKGAKGRGRAELLLLLGADQRREDLSGL